MFFHGDLWAWCACGFVIFSFVFFPIITRITLISSIFDTPKCICMHCCILLSRLYAERTLLLIQMHLLWVPSRCVFHSSNLRQQKARNALLATAQPRATLFSAEATKLFNAIKKRDYMYMRARLFFTITGRMYIHINIVRMSVLHIRVPCVHKKLMSFFLSNSVCIAQSHRIFNLVYVHIDFT